MPIAGGCLSPPDGPVVTERKCLIGRGHPIARLLEIAAVATAMEIAVSGEQRAPNS
jgi:hypothetical protein